MSDVNRDGHGWGGFRCLPACALCCLGGELGQLTLDLAKPEPKPGSALCRRLDVARYCHSTGT